MYSQNPMGLGAPLSAPKDWQPSPDSGLVNPKYINQVLMPDGSVIPIGSFIALPNAAYNLDDVNAHVVQNAWAFVASAIAGGKLALTYFDTGTVPATGSITVTGGVGNQDGTVTPVNTTLTPTGATQQPGTAPLPYTPAPPNAPAAPLAPPQPPPPPPAVSVATLPPAVVPVQVAVPGATDAGAPTDGATDTGAAVTSALSGIPSAVWLGAAAFAAYLLLRKKKAS